MYIMRLSDLYASEDSLKRHWPALLAQLDRGGGLLDHIKAHLFTAQEAETRQWFMGYFDAARQSKDDILRDMDLVTWYYHGHQGIIYPIETLVSPIRSELTQQLPRK